MRFNLETIKEKLTELENEWCGEEDCWVDAEYTEGKLISINIYTVDECDTPDWDAGCGRYGATIYELRDDDKGNWEDETDERIVGQLYFKHIKSHTDGKLFEITSVTDYEHHVYNNMNPKNPTQLKGQVS